MRFTVTDNDISPDTDGRSPGRGYYLCRNEECIEKSFKKKSWNRILRMNADTDKIRRAVEIALTTSKEA